jgi:hypothetical protein
VNFGAFPAGILYQLSHNEEGHAAYLMGEYSMGGWVAYFPIAFAIKTPLALFGLLGLALWRLRRDPMELRVAACVLLAPAAIFLLAGMTSRINIGLRYMLPMYPFLFVFAASAVHAIPALSGRVLSGALVAWFVFSGLGAAPDYLAYFNGAIGGRDHGPEYLLDSNIDWGQDIKPLGVHLRQRGIEEVKLHIFAVEDCRHLGGVRCRPLTCEPTTGDIAISVNALYGLTEAQSHCYAWLREREPVARIGGSIYVYSVNDRAGGSGPGAGEARE